MRARGWVVAAAAALALIPGAGGVRADGKEPRPRPVDIKSFKDRLRLFQDAAGGTYAVLDPTSSDARAWYGAGTTVYEQLIVNRFRDGDAWDLGTWAPRLEDMRPGVIAYKLDGSYVKTCDGKDDAVLTEVTGDKAKALLGKIKFFSNAQIYRPHLFARDETGVYYYIDKLAKEHGGKGYRVFVGRKGAMKKVALTDVASDSAGQVFSTKTGELRLVWVNADTATSVVWVRGGKRTELVPLDTAINSSVIFKDLGIYKFIGTLCDNV